jgi:predicted alpha/beta superfamily hydrolase
LLTYFIPSKIRKYMKNITLLLLLFAASISFAQTIPEEVTSVKLNATREITVVLPPFYKQNKDKKYPLLLVMDGEYLIDAFKGTLNYAAYWDELPETIIVGINQNYGNQREEDCAINEETGLPIETGDKFFEFVNDELMPYLTKKYRISPFRIIAGHDTTARIANFFMYKATSPFTGYILFNPELAAEMETRIPQMAKAVKKPVTYYVAGAGADVERIKKKIKTLDENLKAVKNANFKYMYEEFPAASHFSVIPYSVPGALYTMFASYKPITATEYQEKIVTLPSGYVKYLKDKYTVIEKDLGVKMTIRLNDFKAIEAAIIKNGVYNELRELAELARKNYPKKIIGEYYEGMYYEKTGNAKKAKKTYTSSFAMDNIGVYTKDMMMEKAANISE